MEAVKTKNNIHDFRSELNQISWISSCGAREINIRVKLERDYISQHQEIDPYFWRETSEDSWILDDKYKDSRTKVIGKAIGDCVAGEGAFANKKSGEIITFERTNPAEYEQENWNAVILYNYVHEAINGTAFKEFFTGDKDVVSCIKGGYDPYIKKLSCINKLFKVKDVLGYKLETIKNIMKKKNTI